MAKIKQGGLYESHESVKAFRIAAITTTVKGKILRSGGNPKEVVEVPISKMDYKRLKPKVGEILLINQSGGMTVTNETAFNDRFKLVKKTKSKGSKGRQDRIEAAAMQAYTIWLAAHPKSKINKAPAPVADILFNDEAYAKHAKKWSVAAESTKLK